jgi:cytochrome c oxidase subunit 4
MTPRRPPFPLLAAWLALLGLLALTVSVSYVPLGRGNAAIAISIATVKAGIVAAVFMELWHRPVRTLIFAAAGLFWFALLLWLGLMDFLART